jgi:hypothetical protein
MGQFVMAVSPVLLELCEEMWLKWMSKGARVDVWYCESDALRVCRERPGDDQGASDEDVGDGVNRGAHVDEEED